MAAPQPRRFEINPAKPNVPPLLMGFMGPPGGGKTKSALRVGDGIARVRGGKPLLIDTEAGRALRYHIRHGGSHDFDYVQFTPPFIPADFMAAIKQAVAAGAACIIVDSMSDEHEGEGGVLDWHDAVIASGAMGGNEWAAWSKPKASRRVLISGIQQIGVPVILTFRAREKTVTRPGTKVPVNIGFQPIAPMEIVHTLDLTCLLPPRANGVAVWNSPKEGEDFVIKLPEFLAPMIERGAPLDERMGEALARWQLGQPAPASGNERRKQTPEEQTDAYVAAVSKIETLDSLLEYQTLDVRAKWIAGIKTSRPDLYDRIISANSAQAAKLIPKDDDPNLSDARTGNDGTLSADNPAAHEGRADEQHGDQGDGSDETPVWKAKVDDLFKLINGATTRSIKAVDDEVQKHTAALPEEVADELNSAINAKRKALRNADS